MWNELSFWNSFIFMITCIHTPYQDFVGGCEGSAKRRTVPLCCMVTSTDRKKTLYLWEVSKLTPNRAHWLYAAKHTNDACFKGAAQKIFRVYTHTSGTTKMSGYTRPSKNKNIDTVDEQTHFSKQIYKFQINRNVTSNLFVISINLSSFINWLLMWFIIST